MSTRALTPAVAAPVAVLIPQQRPILQRTCDCGQHTIGGAECKDCRKKKGMSLQRRVDGPSNPSIVPSILHDVLRSPGQPLDEGTLAFFEPRFGGEFARTPVSPARRPIQHILSVGPASDHWENEADAVAGRIVAEPSRASARHDLTAVRIHTGTQAAASARAVNARAYTVGNDIVFNSGQYQPQSFEGRHLLAHELTHVAQQAQSATLQRSVGSAIAGFFSDIGKGIARLFGSENYDPKELQDYLTVLDDGKPEGHYDSDNKARATTKAWGLGGSPYVLTAQRKALMIREMQAGYTSTADEQAIIELLERSYNFELSYIFGVGGITAKSLNSDISGDEFTRLKSFYERRFDGGMEAMLKGPVKPVGYPIPLGSVLPSVGETGMPIDELRGADTRWNEECVAGILCTQDRSTIAALPNMTVLKTPTVTEYYWEYDGASWTEKTKEHAAFSHPVKKIIGFKRDKDCGFAASSMIHEVKHQSQPDTWTIVEKEKDAYTFEENWTIQRGIPGRAPFRMPKADGGEQVNTAAVEKYVVGRYSGATSTPGEEIVDHTSDGKTKIARPDNSTYLRPSRKGDSHQDFKKTDQGLSGAPHADPKKWVCPKTK